MRSHWPQVRTGHLDKLPEPARLFADACDVVADIMCGMKAIGGSVGLSPASGVRTAAPGWMPQEP